MVKSKKKRGSKSNLGLPSAPSNDFLIFSNKAKTSEKDAILKEKMLKEWVKEMHVQKRELKQKEDEIISRELKIKIDKASTKDLNSKVQDFL